MRLISYFIPLSTPASLPPKAQLKQVHNFYNSLPTELQKRLKKIIVENGYNLDEVAFRKISNMNLPEMIQRHSTFYYLPVPLNHNLQFASSTMEKEAIKYQISHTACLKTLDISYCKNLKEEDVKDILKILVYSSPSLEHLNLSGLDISDNTLAMTLKCFPKLKSLSINNCTALTKNCISRLISWVKKNELLNSLNVSGLDTISSNYLLGLFQSLNNQKTLNLNNLNQLKENEITSIIESFKRQSPNIHSFQAAYTRLTPEHLAVIQESYKDLKLVNLSGCVLSLQALFNFFKNCKLLRELSLCSLPVNDELVKNILSNNPSLELLYLKECREITNEGFIQICQQIGERKTPLRALNLEYLSINAETLLTGCRLLIPCLKKLRELNLSTLPLTPEIMSVVAENCAQLRVLELNGIYTLSDQEMADFFKQLAIINHKLTTLSIKDSNLDISRSEAQTIQNLYSCFKNLRYINLQNSTNFFPLKEISTLIKTHSNFQSLIISPSLFDAVDWTRYTNPRIINTVSDSAFYFPNQNFNLFKLPKTTRQLSPIIHTIAPIGETWIKSLAPPPSQEWLNGRVQIGLGKINSNEKVIDLYRSKALTGDVLREILNTHQQIDVLNLSGTNLNDASLAEAIILLKEHSPNLKVLGLQNLLISKETLFLIFKNFPKLRALDLTDTEFGEEIVRPFIAWIKNNANLESLGIPPKLSLESVSLIIDATSNLKYLSLEKKNLLSANYKDMRTAKNILCRLRKWSPNIQGLNFANHSVFGNHLFELPGFFQKLTALILPGDYIENCGKTLIKWPNLEILKNFFPYVSDFVEVAAYNKRLKHLSLCLDNLSANAFLNGCRSIQMTQTPLESLEIFNRNSYSDFDPLIFRDGLEAISSQLVRIKSLTLETTSFNDDGLELLAQTCGHLTQLNISNSSITGKKFVESMRIIGRRNTQLISLTLGTTNLKESSPGIRVLAPLVECFHQLRFLDFSYGISFDSEDLAREIPLILKANPLLEEVNIYLSMKEEDIETLLQHPEFSSRISNYEPRKTF